MIVKLQAAYLGASRQPILGPRRTAGRTTMPESTARVAWRNQAAKAITASLLEAVVILAFVGLSLGIGGEANTAASQDRSAQPVSPVPAPAPGPVRVSVD